MDPPHSQWRQAHLEDRIEESWEAALAKPPDLTKKTSGDHGGGTTFSILWGW